MSPRRGGSLLAIRAETMPKAPIGALYGHLRRLWHLWLFKPFLRGIYGGRPGASLARYAKVPLRFET